MIETECLFDCEPATYTTSKQGKPLQLYTYFGCKKKVVDLVWRAWGPEVTLVVEPFAGTAVISLNAPEGHNVKNWYLNDYDMHVANVLRSVRYHPDTVVEYAAHPRLEIDMHQIHDYLMANKPSLRDLLLTGIEACDPKLAGWWIWGCNNWLGSQWCACPIKPDEVFLKNEDLKKFEDAEGTWRKKPNNRNRITESLTGTWRQKPVHSNRITESLTATGRQKLSSNNCITESLTATGRQKPNNRNRITESLTATGRQKLNNCNRITESLTATGRKKPNNCNRITEQLTDNSRTEHIRGLVHRAYEQLRDTTILYGDFGRVLTNSYLGDSKNVGIVLDPPYPSTNMANGGSAYSEGRDDEQDTFHRAWAWFVEHHEDADKRIVFCCQESCLEGLTVPGAVRVINWTRNTGYSSGNKKTDAQKDTRSTELLLLSTACHMYGGFQLTGPQGGPDDTMPK